MVGTALFAARNASAAQLTLTWVDNAGGTAYFTIERKTDTTGTYAPISTTPTGATTYADTTVVTGTTYCYRVKASNAAGDSAYSDDACGSPAAGVDLSVAKAGPGSGTVVSNPSAIDCGSTCATSYPAGKVITLTASPALGSFFSGWSGASCAGTDPCVIAGNTPVAVTATFAVDNAPPTVSISAPSNGASLSGSVRIAVNATDNVAVTRVELWVDGALVATDTSGSGSLAWDSTTTSNGVHSLLAKAYDAAGNVTSSAPVSVTVNNSQNAPTPAMALSFTGKTRDRVGQDITVSGPDGALDGTFVLTLAQGVGPRTITQLELRRRGPVGIWDTDPMSSFWLLGVAGSLDGPLLNTADGALSISLPAGSSVILFAADLVDLFVPGSVFTLTATFADGTTAAASTTIAVAPVLSLAFTGAVRDRVGQGNLALGPDGALDGAFFLTLAPGAGPRAITKLELRRTGPIGIWDTDPASPFWALGVAGSLDGPLLNAPDGALSLILPEAGGAVLFAADFVDLFVPGSVFTLTATFADGTTAAASTTIAAAPALSLAFIGTVRDRVGQGNLALAPDGAPDGAFFLTLAPGAGPRTITKLELRRTGPIGIWDTDPASPFWALGVAASLDGPLLNSPESTLSFILPEAGAALLFAADFVDLFTPGSVFTLTATFADGSTASAIASIPPGQG